ncbi:MAG: DUF4129 domain-containing protein [Candidatus Promineifilaceae bacterium]|nr:DUF4129 domain-containing protein [Candidatus Promineifilaceae bacterium]
MSERQEQGGRRWRARIATLVAGAAAVAALLFVAGTLPQMRFRRGLGLPGAIDLFRNQRLQPPQFEISPLLLDIVTVLLWVMFLLALIYVFLTPSLRRKLPRLVLRVILLNMIWVLPLLLFILPTETAPEAVLAPEGPAPTPIGGVDNLESPLGSAVPAVDPPPVVTLLLTVLFTAGVAGLASLWWLRRAEPVPESPLDAVSDEAEEALVALRRGERVDDVILRCYRQMGERVAAARGLYRGETATAREFEQQLRTAGLPEEPVEALTRLFEQVRYGTFRPGEAERERAIASLEAIVAACRPKGDQRPLQRPVGLRPEGGSE